MLYFAYGSNMNWNQMKNRCPSAKFTGVAKLPGHRLAFTRKSVNRGCGVADAVGEAGRDVWGVVFEISELDVKVLDKSEGFRHGCDKNSYYRCESVVLLDGDEQRPVTAETYFAEQEPNPPPPSQAYKDLILSGARHWHLPTDYLAELAALEVRG